MTVPITRHESSRRPPLIALVFAFLFTGMTAPAATYYVATNGSDSTGNGSITSPWATPSKCVQSVSTSGGDTCIIRPGTYGGVSFTRSGTASAKNTLRAEFPRISCAGDDCSRQTSSITTLTGTVSLAANDHWIISGFFIKGTGTSPGTGLNAGGSLSSRVDGIEVRYNEFEGQTGQMIAGYGALNWNIHHNLFTDFASSGTDSTDGCDYGIQLVSADSILVTNNVWRGKWGHNVSAKRRANNVTIRNNIMLGARWECIMIGQNSDDTDSSGDSTGTLLGGSSSTRNHTSQRTLAEWNFISKFSNPAESGAIYNVKFPFRVSNTYQSVIRYNYTQLCDSPLLNLSGAWGQTDISTGERSPQPNDLDVYGNTAVHGGGLLEVARLTARGWNDDRIRIFNNTFHSNPDPAVRVDSCTQQGHTCLSWWQTSTGSGTILEYYNNNMTSLSGTFTFATTGTVIAQEGDNNWYQSGGTRGASGDLSTSPLYIGPTTAPATPNALPTTWNFWGAVSQYLGTTSLDRWRYQSGSPLINTGRTVPTTDVMGNTISFWTGSAPDIGSNEVLLNGAPPPPPPPPGCITAPTSGAWVNSSITNQTGTFAIEFDTTPSASGLSGVVGLSNGTATDFTSLAAIVAFESTGVVDVRNGGSYMADATFNYSGGATYHFRLVVNVPTHTYSVYVTGPTGPEITLATNYAFRTEQASVTQLNNVGSRMSSGGTIDTCNILVSNCMTAPISGTWVNTATATKTGTFTAEFDVTPSAGGMAGVVGLSNGPATDFTSLACIVGFETSGIIDVRNGGVYGADTTVTYTANGSYHFRLVINVTNHTYTVYVTPPGSSEITLATNYAFRTEQAGVTQLNNVGSRISSGGTLTTCTMTVQ